MRISPHAAAVLSAAVVWSTICAGGADAFRTTSAGTCTGTTAFHGAFPLVRRTTVPASSIKREDAFGIASAAGLLRDATASRRSTIGRHNAFVPRAASALFANADGEDGVEVVIGKPIDDSADTLEVDPDDVVVHPANGEAASPEAKSGESSSTKTDPTAGEPLVLEPVPPASHSVEQDDSGPDGGKVTTLTVNLGAPGHPDPIVIQTGKVGRQAAGAITLTRGDTVLLATAARDDKPKESIDFLPLSVEHQERFSSAGLTSGSYNRRDGRPAEHEILTCRLIDRPLRPLIADGWRHETQLLSWVLSYDGIRSCDPLAITASAASLWISDVPLSKPVAAASVGYIDGQFVLNPTNDQMERSRLHLTVAGTMDAVLMIEGAADFLPEATMTEAITFGHKAIKVLCEGLDELGKVVGREKNYDTIVGPPEGLQDAVDEFADDVMAMYESVKANKDEEGKAMKELQNRVLESLEDQYPEKESEIKGAFKDLLCRQMFNLAKTKGVRCDGRALDEVRRIDAEAGILPRVHGSALFTRGETQSIATATLGSSGMKQKIDTIDGGTAKRFYLQYAFPPSCVGETGRTGAPGRREVGHGNLAERALAPILPSEETFPYSIRVESLITESHGSSSMASVCGGCLALMDAGVPIRSPVAGIAMGMLLGDKGGVSDENAVIVSDILGTEDALGTMDFKVAGDREGITTFQLDIKCEGLTLETMGKALQQAKEGRLHILDRMEEVLGEYRKDLPDSVPKMGQFQINADTIGKVIGPGGKQIRAIIEDFGLTDMNVEEDGTIQLSGMNRTKLEMAEGFVKDLVASGGGGGRGGRRSARAEYVGPDPEIGKVYNGKITGIHDFGVFVEILPGAEDGSTPGCEGLCHVSELHVERVRNCPGFVASLNTEELEVKVLGRTDKGKLQLSRKAVLEDRGVSGNKGGKRNYGQGKQNRKSLQEKKSDSPPEKAEMSDEEISAIAQAIEEVKDL